MNWPWFQYTYELFRTKLLYIALIVFLKAVLLLNMQSYKVMLFDREVYKASIAEFYGAVFKVNVLDDSCMYDNDDRYMAPAE